MPATGYSEQNKPCTAKTKTEAACLHEEVRLCFLLYRAQPATEMKRSEIEVHGLFCNAKERNKEAACLHEEVRLCFLLYRAHARDRDGAKRNRGAWIILYFVT